MSDDDVRIYDRLKVTILSPYQLTSEAQRQKFRKLKKIEPENYCEFAAKKKKKVLRGKVGENRKFE